jgi:hypothetical protein
MDWLGNFVSLNVEFLLVLIMMKKVGIVEKEKV